MAVPERTLPQPGAAQAPELDFRVDEVAAVQYAAVPTLRFALGVEHAAGGPIRSLTLMVQLRIAASRRQYGAAEQERLLELFGEPGRWSTTLRSLPWTRTTLIVPAFTGRTVVDLDVPCSYDFEVTAAKYLAALDGGDVPLELLFGGTVFFAAPDGRLQAAQISWSKEAACSLPVATWREAIDRHFPNAAWVRVQRETFDALYAYRARHALTDWDATLGALLEEADD